MGAMPMNQESQLGSGAGRDRGAISCRKCRDPVRSAVVVAEAVARPSGCNARISSEAAPPAVLGGEGLAMRPRPGAARHGALAAATRRRRHEGRRPNPPQDESQPGASAAGTSRTSNASPTSSERRLVQRSTWNTPRQLGGRSTWNIPPSLPHRAVVPADRPRHTGQLPAPEAAEDKSVHRRHRITLGAVA